MGGAEAAAERRQAGESHQEGLKKTIRDVLREEGGRLRVRTTRSERERAGGAPGVERGAARRSSANGAHAARGS
jgi:hypothetical protein